VLIVGGGPAGLTAAYELLARGENIHPIVFEKSDYLGGISSTHNYKGNRIDVGGHRFFSKSDRVMNWWLRFMPLQSGIPAEVAVSYQNASRTLGAVENDSGRDPKQFDLVMLVRKRISRIFYLRRFFDYPISLNKNTVANLGLVRMSRIAASYCWSCLFPIRPEKNLEQFFINRFGRELYRTFFQSYTEKVWGVPCKDIGAEWGAQRVRGLSIAKTLLHAVRQFSQRDSVDVRQKRTETSLIERFLYPKFGPGQMWEEVARQIRDKGGEVLEGHEVRRVLTRNNEIIGVEAVDKLTGQSSVYHGEFLLSSMPVKELVLALDCEKPPNVLEVSQGLVYRDFITVGLLLKQFKPPGNQSRGRHTIQDCWIYVQEPDVQVGRIQIFNNWSPYMVQNASNVWVGLEYFCNQTDAIWRKTDVEMIQFATEELYRMGFIEQSDVLDATVIRMEKTYPAYLGTYDRFDEIRTYLDGFSNLFLMGRNGMHRYNNQDHSMLTAMTVVDLILSGSPDKSAVWSVNADQEYHEQKS
jgi:protoporphyrinogen oxidase